jgi:hypothetical protein
MAKLFADSLTEGAVAPPAGLFLEASQPRGA